MIATIMERDLEYTLASDDDAKMRTYLKLVFDKIYWAPQVTFLVLNKLNITFLCHIVEISEGESRDGFEDWDLDEDEDEDEEEGGEGGKEGKGGKEGDEGEGEAMCRFISKL